MLINQALNWGAKKLKEKNLYLNIDFLDAEILLAFVIKKPREFLYSHPGKKLTASQSEKYKQMIARRKKGEPIAYIIGYKEFYGKKILVSPNVLIPRPETELLIDIAKKTIKHQRSDNLNIIDIGTGSGAVAITLKKLFPKANIYAVEKSPKAIKAARKNAITLKGAFAIKKGDLLSPFKKLPKNPIIIANLPYLSEAEWQKTMPDVKYYEPSDALVGGKNGWELYKKLFEQIKKLNPKNATIIIEIGHAQKSAISKLLKKYFKPKKIEAVCDLNNKWRIMKTNV